MAINWTCPYAIRFKVIRGLGCKAMVKADTDLSTTEGAMSVYCVCQRYCPDERRIINSEGARQCFEKMTQKV